MPDKTIYQMLQDSVSRFGGRNALGRKVGGEFEYLTYKELWDRVQALRKGLISIGMIKGDRVAILSENRPEWAITDLAAQSLGVITVPIYPTLPSVQVQYLVTDSAAKALFISDKKQFAKIMDIRANAPGLKYIIAMEGESTEEVIAFQDVLESGRASKVTAEDLDKIAATVNPDDTATLIYTSGTTGNPKGAMLSHKNLLHTAFAARKVVNLDENDVFLSFAPLSHIIERTGGHYLPLSLGATIVYSGGLFTIGSEFAAVKPTVFLCVPRLYESMQEKIMDQRGKLPSNKKRIFDWAIATGKVAGGRTLRGRKVGLILGLKWRVADKLVLKTIREKATGGRARFFVAGGAPLNPSTAIFFEAIGVHLLEGYGLTECPVISLNRPENRRAGTVGPILPGIEAKVAADGEILARGPSLMQGYYGKPDATAEVIDADGWFHTGDIGEVTPEGFLRITDRKKDIIVLANGKNVAPQPIEAKLKESPFISEAVLLGDKSSTVVAIIVPAFERLRVWAKENDLPIVDLDELTRRAETHKLFRAEIDRHSSDLADFERVKRFRVVPQPFSIEGGELTPTLKVKRKVVSQKYAPLIEQLARSSA